MAPEGVVTVRKSAHETLMRSLPVGVMGLLMTVGGHLIGRYEFWMIIPGLMLTLVATGVGVVAYVRIEKLDRQARRAQYPTSGSFSNAS
jgi:hypothetical protein